MKLSRAMMKGISKSPFKQHGRMFGYDFKKDNEVGIDFSTSCALGAALLGKVGQKEIKKGKYNKLVFKAFPELHREIIFNPETGNMARLSHVIVSLNDTYGWPRSCIAEYIGTYGL